MVALLTNGCPIGAALTQNSRPHERGDHHADARVWPAALMVSLREAPPGRLEWLGRGSRLAALAFSDTRSRLL